MNLNRIRMALLILLMLGTSPAFAQDQPQIINIPVSKPGEPITLEISILSARIEVIGEDREDAEFTITVEEGERKIITPSGTKSLKTGAYTLEIEEEDNHIYVDTDWRANKISIVARIPRRADLELSTVNDGEILVSNITGNLLLENTNGAITAKNITGSVIAETINDSIDVSFASVDASNANSLISFNGDINLGLPRGAKVQLHLDSARGEIYSDFEVEIKPSKPVIERSNEHGGVAVRIESIIIAEINGGGSVIKLKTLNGDINISKAAN